ncbi:MAG: hypothetical protein DRN64_01470 [Thaumarchaeota archaeon]|nr:MAG: hypothetical protein DRN64_01470 [Nitrososphaerota archaeon]
MSADEEEFLRDIEEEVRRLLEGRRGRGRRGKKFRITYVRLDDGLSGEKVEKALREGAVIIALRGEDLGSLMDRVRGLLEGVRSSGGSAYLIRQPALLILGEDAELVSL